MRLSEPSYATIQCRTTRREPSFESWRLPLLRGQVKLYTTNSIALARDRRGRVEEVILLNHADSSRVSGCIRADQLQLREATLRNTTLKYGGIPLKYEDGIELWAVGDRGARFTITIPSADQLILNGDSAKAATFLNALVKSEQQLGAWLTEHLKENMQSSTHLV